MRDSVRQAIQMGLESVRRDPIHALSPYCRNDIYNAIGPLFLAESRCVRTALAIAAAKKVLPIWYVAHPTDTRATRLLDLATIQARRSDYDETVDTQIEEAWNWLTNDYDDRVEELSDDALFAMAAALEALILACGTDRFLGVEISKDMTDANLDMWCSDAAKHASIAFAGAIWESNSSPQKRLAFWEWWLGEAIPECVDSCL